MSTDVASRLAAFREMLGDERVHHSHRSALVRKNPEFYGQLFPAAEPDSAYFWPV
jgi:hypothetical protein